MTGPINRSNSTMIAAARQSLHHENQDRVFALVGHQPAKKCAAQRRSRPRPVTASTNNVRGL